MSTRREFIRQVAAASLVVAPSLQTTEAAHARLAANTRKGARNEPLKLAIVGTGQISPRYLKQGAESKRARFVATCARTLGEAKARAVEYGIGAWFDDYNKMYDAVAPDGVVIATPNALHVAPTVAALERDIAVLCEKPMATTWKDCQTIVGAAQKSKAVFLALPYDATPSFLAALEHLNVATLGVFASAEAQILFTPTMFQLPDWHYQQSMAGGWGLNSLVYPVSRLIGLLGPAQRVIGFSNTLFPRRTSTSGKPLESDIDDNVSLLIEWAGGQQGLVRTFDSASHIRNDTVIYCTEGTLWLSSGGLVIHSPKRPLAGAEPITWNGQKDCFRVAVQPRANEGLIEHFVDCIQGIAAPTCGGEQQLHVHEILFKGREAAHSGKVQELETTFTPWHRIEPAFHDARSRRL